MNSEEKKYQDLLKSILNTGSYRKDRTGVGTIGTFGTQLKFSLEDNVVPMLTTKKMFTKGVIEELLFFLRGETDTKKLEAKGINIWKGNTSREYLNGRNLYHLPEGDMGKGYGFQWRQFGGDDNKWHLGEDGSFTKHGFDQLHKALHLIKNDPNSRKIIVSAWNPAQLHEMALEPCHCLFQFHVNDGKLSLQWYQRSVDIFLGLPFNIASYAILTIIFAKAANLKPGEIIFAGGDTHIYQNHVDQVKEQLTREPFEFPKIYIDKDILSIKDMEKLEYSDFRIENYQSHPAIKAIMAI